MESNQKKKVAAFTNNRDLNIFYRIWKTDERPKGIVVVVHGFNSHSGYYEDFAMQLNGSHFEVYAIDLPGRGQSDGERYYIEEYNDVVADIDQLVNIAKKSQPALPVFLFGHSAGGVFASVYVLFHRDKLNGLIAESIAFRLPAPGFALAAIKFFSYIIPHTRIFRLKNEHFSRDKSIVNGMNNDPSLANEKQSAKTMQQLILAAEYLENKMPQIKLPLLIIHGAADKVTKPGGSRYFMEHASSVDKQLKLYEGYYHDLLNEKFNGIIVKDIIRWLNERV